MRKETGLEVSDRINLEISGDEEVKVVCEKFEAYIKNETLTSEMKYVDDLDIQENEVHNSETGLTENKKSKRGYISGETGEEYRGTSLHDAKDGLFICDENVDNEFATKQKPSKIINI